MTEGGGGGWGSKEWGSGGSGGQHPPETVGNLGFMVEWSISVRSQLFNHNYGKRQNWPIFAQNFSD